MASINRRPNGSYEARYRPVPSGVQIRRCFRRKVDAQRWLDEQTATLVTGTHVHPTEAKITVTEWSERWLAGYGTRRPSTVRQARVHLAQITAAFGDCPLGSLRPSDIKAWTAALRAEGTADSYVYALHNRVAQLMSDAVHDGLIARSPCSRRTSPPAGRQRPYVASTEQVRALHEVFPTHLRPAVLLGAYAGLRTAEVVGLRRGDVDLEAGVVCPVQQAGGLELKTAMSRTPVPVPRRLAEALLTPRDGVLEDGALDGLTLPQKPHNPHNPQNPEPPGDSAATAVSAATSRPRDGLPDTPVVTDETGQRPTSTWAIERAIRSARPKIAGLPEGFRYHDLRHYYASMLIASGLDVKTVQHRLRHGSATTTLNTYGHLWPDGDERTRAAVDGALGDLLD